MPNDHPNLPGHPMHPLTDQMVYHAHHPPIASVFDGFMSSVFKPHRSFHNVDIKPSDDCPRNFVIFDQTNNRRQIMFHPEISSEFIPPGFGASASIFQDHFDTKDANDVKSITSQEEDSDDIDALYAVLSTDDEEWDDDDDVVSTARMDASYYCNSPDSFSNYESHPKRSRSLFLKSSQSCSYDKKRHRTRKMVNALRGIVPGADDMGTVAVLDEAVRYLKSLRVEVQKLGPGN